MGFGLACAPVRYAHPSFWGHCHAKRGAARPPPIAAALLHIHTPKIKKIYRTRAACVKGYILSTLPPRPESIQSDRPSIQSSELAPPPPHLQESVAPPLGGRPIYFQRRGWGGGDQFLHSGTLGILQSLDADAMKYIHTLYCHPTSATHITSSLIFPAINIYKKTTKNHSMGVFPLISMICRENPAKCPSLPKNPPKYATAYIVQQSNCRWHCEPTFFLRWAFNKEESLHILLLQSPHLLSSISNPSLYKPSVSSPLSV